MRPLRTEALRPGLRATADRIRTKDRSRSLPGLLGRVVANADTHHQSLWPGPHESRRAGVSGGQHERILLRFKRAAGANRHHERRIDQVVNYQFADWSASVLACMF